jgi:hypothetical protein
MDRSVPSTNMPGHSRSFRDKSGVVFLSKLSYFRKTADRLPTTAPTRVLRLRSEMPVNCTVVAADFYGVALCYCSLRMSIHPSSDCWYQEYTRAEARDCSQCARMVHLETCLTVHRPVPDIPQSMVLRCTSDLAMCSYSFQVMMWSSVSTPRRNPLSTLVTPGNRRTVSPGRPGLYIRNCPPPHTDMLTSHRKLTERSPHVPEAGVSIRSGFDGVSLAAQS